MTTDELLALRDFRITARFNKNVAGKMCHDVSASDPGLALRLVNDLRHAHAKRPRTTRMTIEISALPPGSKLRVAVGAVELEDAVEPQFAAMHAAHRNMRAASEVQEQQNEILERKHRRLIAAEIDTTGDMLDQLAGDCPLLAFRF